MRHQSLDEIDHDTREAAVCANCGGPESSHLTERRYCYSIYGGGWKGYDSRATFQPAPAAPPPTLNTPMKTSLNDYSRECHEANKKWWVSIEDGITPLDRNKGELICLMHSELSEAMEGERKNLMDDKLPHRRMAEVELVDCLIRIFDYAGAFGYDLEAAYTEKMTYNAQREDHKHEARALAGGKKW